jgi:hypothetical protein
LVFPPFAVVPFHFELTSSAAFIAKGANFAAEEEEDEVAAAVDACLMLRGIFLDSRNIVYDVQYRSGDRIEMCPIDIWFRPVETGSAITGVSST